MGRSQGGPPTRIARGAVALALIVALSASATGAAAVMGAPTTETTDGWSPDSWHPVDDGIVWGEAVITPFVGEALGGCERGNTYVWPEPNGQRIGLAWLECDDAGAAAALIATNLLAGNFPESTIAPAFGASIDVATVRGNGSDLLRWWSQGSHYFSLARDCGTSEECVDATARYAIDLSTQLGEPLNDLPSVVPADDPLASFHPSGSTQEWARVSYSPVRGSVDELPGECEDGGSVVWMARDGTIARAFWWGCLSPRMAFLGFTYRWQEQSLPRRSDLEGVLGQGSDRAGTYLEGRGIARSWVQGATYVNVQRDCPLELTQACIDSSADDVQAVSSLMSGQVLFDDRANAQLLTAGAVFILVPAGSSSHCS